MIYAYVRVSTKEQSVDRQIDSIKNYCPSISRKNIYIEFESGKNNNREIYTKMRSKLKANDELIIHELDRISRDKDFIKSQLEYFRNKKIILRILELPTTLYPFSKETAWVGEMINNIIIEVYSTIAQHERERIAERIVQGQDAAKQRGRVGGRPAMSKDTIDRALKLFKEGYPVNEICKMIKISKPCFYKNLKMRILEFVDQGKSDDFIIEELGITYFYLQETKMKNLGGYV
jgi:DNA invertase Pin-like site-specific DNA recombinase